MKCLPVGEEQTGRGERERGGEGDVWEDWLTPRRRDGEGGGGGG